MNKQEKFYYTVGAAVVGAVAGRIIGCGIQVVKKGVKNAKTKKKES